MRLNIVIRCVLAAILASIVLSPTAFGRAETFGDCDIFNPNPNFWPNEPGGGEVSATCQCTTQQCETYISSGQWALDFSAAFTDYCNTYYNGIQDGPWVEVELGRGTCVPLGGVSPQRSGR